MFLDLECELFIFPISNQDYFEVIKEPMDLTTIQQQLESGIYQHYTQVVHHLLVRRKII